MSNGHFLIVGGTRGIGLSLANTLAQDTNRRVSVFGRNTLEIPDKSNVLTYSVDVLITTDLISVLDRAVDSFGKFDGIIFMQRNRGGDGDFETDIAVSLTATKNAIDHIVSSGYFFRDGRSNIVIVSSVVAEFIALDQPAGYHIGKAGLTHLCRFYAKTLGPLGVRVNSVAPCVVLKDEAIGFYGDNQWLVDRFNRYIPLGRMGRPSDIIGAIMFLLSEQSSYITGQSIVIDGGLSLVSHESLLRDIEHK